METKEIVAVETPRITQKEIDDYLYGSGTKLTEQQKAMFYQVAMINNLNPFKREVYAIPYGDKFNIITGYEVYLKRAERSGKLAGWTADAVKEGTDLVGVCSIWRKDWDQPLTIKAWFSEYNQGNRMWKEKPRTMIRKVAIAQAFRMAFSEELAGMPYTADEISTHGEVVEAEVVQKEQPMPSAPPQEAPQPQGQQATGGDMQITEPMAKRLYAIAKKAGNTDDEIKGVIIQITGQGSTRAITRKHYNQIVDILERKQISGTAWSEPSMVPQGSSAEDIPF